MIMNSDRQFLPSSRYFLQLYQVNLQKLAFFCHEDGSTL